MRLRPTSSGDLEELHAVFGAAIGEVFGRHGLAAPAPSLEVFVAQHEHLLRHDAERCAVAEDGGRIAGYAAAFVRRDTWFLASLFVRPDAQARGVGTALLDRVWWAGASRRLTITDAIQPVSNALYGRRGLIPATPVLAFAGAPRIESPGRLGPALPDAAALRSLDLAAYGFDRAVDHALWRGTACATLWLRDGEPAAYAYAWPDGSIGPVAGSDASHAAAALQAELARATGSVSVRIPGSAAASVEVALAAGLRLTGPPGLLLVSRPHRPPDALAIASFTLF